MNDVFLDSVGLLALWNASDQWNQSAVRAYQLLLTENVSMWTTTLILMECGNRVARRADFRILVADFKQAMEETGRLIRPSPNDEEVAWLAYRRGEAGQAGIIDQASFAVMRRLGLTRAFTNDAHFQAAGFQTLF